MRLGAERIAQNAQIRPFCHRIARRKITKRNGIRITGDVGHILGNQHRISEQTRRLSSRQPVRPKEPPIRILKLAHRPSGLGVHHETAVGAILRPQGIDQIHKRITAIKIPVHARGHIAQIAPAPARLRHNRMGQNAGWLVHAIPGDEGCRLCTGKLVCNPPRQPGFNVKGTVIQQPLRGFGQRRQLMQRNGNPLNCGGGGFAPCRCFIRPARLHIRAVNQHIKRARLNRHHIGNSSNAGCAVEHGFDGLRRLRIHQISTIAVHGRRHGLAFQFQPPQPVIFAGTEIGIKGLLMGGMVIIARRQLRPRRLNVCAFQHGQSLFLLLQICLHITSKGFETTHECRHCCLHVLNRRHIFSDPRVALGFAHHTVPVFCSVLRARSAPRHLLPSLLKDRGHIAQHLQRGLLLRH
ncbi:hypothetical protein SHM7688_02909 [Shimia marina]|uniref:Uncharacterized protein n=1 Tax=Shimia marina TaxID=321267 RepID=A0A0P1ESP8_9RHOB|nr:hypothetical protein SHM7688_02909 [Shimia marina]